MKKIITTLTAMTFVLGVAAAGQAQVVKPLEKPAVQSTQATPAQVAPKEATKSGELTTKEAVKPGEPAAKEMVKPGETKEPLKGEKVTHKAQKKARKAAKKGEKKATAPMEKPQEGTK